MTINNYIFNILLENIISPKTILKMFVQAGYDESVLNEIAKKYNESSFENLYNKIYEKVSFRATDSEKYEPKLMEMYKIMKFLVDYKDKYNLEMFDYYGMSQMMRYSEKLLKSSSVEEIKDVLENAYKKAVYTDFSLMKGKYPSKNVKLYYQDEKVDVYEILDAKDICLKRLGAGTNWCTARGMSREPEPPDFKTAKEMFDNYVLNTHYYVVYPKPFKIWSKPAGAYRKFTLRAPKTIKSADEFFELVFKFAQKNSYFFRLVSEGKGIFDYKNIVRKDFQSLFNLLFPKLEKDIRNLVNNTTNKESHIYTFYKHFQDDVGSPPDFDAYLEKTKSESLKAFVENLTEYYTFFISTNDRMMAVYWLFKDFLRFHSVSWLQEFANYKSLIKNAFKEYFPFEWQNERQLQPFDDVLLFKRNVQQFYLVKDFFASPKFPVKDALKIINYFESEEAKSLLNALDFQAYQELFEVMHEESVKFFNRLYEFMYKERKRTMNHKDAVFLKNVDVLLTEESVPEVISRLKELYSEEDLNTLLKTYTFVYADTIEKFVDKTIKKLLYYWREEEEAQDKSKPPSYTPSTKEALALLQFLVELSKKGLKLDYKGIKALKNYGKIIVEFRDPTPRRLLLKAKTINDFLDFVKIMEEKYSKSGSDSPEKLAKFDLVYRSKGQSGIEIYHVNVDRGDLCNVIGFGTGTTWCTARRKRADMPSQYKEGEFYIIIPFPYKESEEAYLEFGKHEYYKMAMFIREPEMKLDLDKLNSYQPNKTVIQNVLKDLLKYLIENIINQREYGSTDVEAFLKALNTADNLSLLKEKIKGFLNRFSIEIFLYEKSEMYLISNLHNLILLLYILLHLNSGEKININVFSDIVSPTYNIQQLHIFYNKIGSPETYEEFIKKSFKAIDLKTVLEKYLDKKYLRENQYWFIFDRINRWAFINSLYESREKGEEYESFVKRVFQLDNERLLIILTLFNDWWGMNNENSIYEILIKPYHFEINDNMQNKILRKTQGSDLKDAIKKTFPEYAEEIISFAPVQNLIKKVEEIYGTQKKMYSDTINNLLNRIKNAYIEVLDENYDELIKDTLKIFEEKFNKQLEKIFEFLKMSIVTEDDVDVLAERVANSFKKYKYTPQMIENIEEKIISLRKNTLLYNPPELATFTKTFFEKVKRKL